MALHSGLSVWCYTAPTSANPMVGPVEYGAALESLRFTTVAPGGFGQLSAYLKVRDARVPRPELGIFSRVVLPCGRDALWIGEISESKATLQSGQEAVRITALGLGNVIRDDAFMFSYSGKTVQQIAQDQLQARTATGGYTTAAWKGVIDPDGSQLFADNPAGTYAPVWDFKQFEEILGDLCLLAAANTGASGLYLWGTEAHPINRDAAGFPTVRLFARLKDTATTHYQASVAADEVTEYEIGQSAERCYNDVDIGYNNAAGGVGRAVATDARLNADHSQNTAPFRWRKFARDLSGTSTLNGTTAAQLASTLLAQYQDPVKTGKSTITLRAVRDANGAPTELARLGAAAGKNILVPEMAVRTTGALPTGPVAGVNQFFIVSAEYVEDQMGATVHLQCDNFADYEAIYTAKLTLAADTRARSDKTNATFQAPGAPETGYCGGTFTASAAGQTGSDGQNFKKIMAVAPTSVNISNVVSSVNATGASAGNFDVYGFNVSWQSVAAGVSTFLAHYVTVGNCLLDVRTGGPEDGTFDWHCDGCEARLARAHGCGDRAGHGCPACREGATHRGLRLGGDGAHARVGRPTLADGTVHERPGDTTFVVDCPAPGCGHIECFNTALSEEDEAHPDPRRREQARLIRLAMRHPQVGLPTREEWEEREAERRRRETR